MFGVCTAAHADVASDRADQIFLQQLTERQFFELAEQHCEYQIERATDSETKAAWLLRLSKVYELHAWQTEPVGRGELLSLSIQQITEFIGVETISPEMQFRLRLQQSRLLGRSIRMQLIVNQASRLFGTFSNTDSHSHVRSLNPDTELASINVIQQSLELTESLISQLDQNKRSLDSLLAREIRDDARLQRAEIHCLKFQLQLAMDSPETQDTLNLAREAVDQLVRSTRDDVRKSFGRSLLAELALHESAKGEFQLLIQGIGEASDNDPLLRAECLAVRGLLAAREPTKALTLLQRTAGTSVLQTQHLEWLKLESLLGVHELATTLKDSKLQAETSQQFEQQLLRIRQVVKGVFRDACERTSQRFSLIAEVGIEIADLVEQVEALRAAGDSAGALRQIDVAIQRLPAKASLRARAALMLRSGELLAGSNRWVEADQRLQSAFRLYGEGGMLPEQAAADLLRIYVAAQLLREQPATESLSAYVASLEEHLKLFSEQRTADQARQWLLDVIDQTDSHRAAELSLQILKAAPKPQMQIQLMERLGGQLLRCSRESNSGTASLIAEFEVMVADMINDPDRFPPDDMVAVRLQRLELMFAQMSEDDSNWSSIASQLGKLQLELLSRAVEDPSTDDSASVRRQDFIHRCRLMEAVVIARAGNDMQRRSDLATELRNTPESRLSSSIDFLSSQYQHDTFRAGDTWLARNCQSLLKRFLETDRGDKSFAEKIRLLKIIVTTTRITEERQLQESFLATLLSSPLDSDQTAQIAEILSRRSGTAYTQNSPDNARKREGGTATDQAAFWRKVAQQQTQGSDLWLESQLQLAEAAFESDRLDNARKLLGFVEAIYPTWGTTERQQRASELSKRLSGSK